MQLFLLFLNEIKLWIMMNKIIYFVLLSLALAACKDKNQYHIEGNFDQLSDSTIFLKQMEVSNATVIDSSRINKDGAFNFKGETPHPRFYQLALSNNNFITMLIQPGEDVQLQIKGANLTNSTIEGSPGTEKVYKLNTRLRQTKQKLDSLKNLYEMAEAKDAGEERLEEINQAYRQVLNQQRDSSIAFILDNMGSLASIVALYQKVDDETFVLYKNQDLQYIKLVADSLENKYPESKHVKSLLADKERLMRKYKNVELNQKLAEMKDKVTDQLPDIALPTMSGDTVSFSDLNSKMVLLSFWASWKDLSVERNLKLKKLYRKYHDKGFEIYQVSLDQTRDKWKYAVKFDELPWINVYNPGGFSSLAAKKYNVKQVPTDFLIRNKKEIVAKNPDISQLNKKLSAALN